MPILLQSTRQIGTWHNKIKVELSEGALHSILARFNQDQLHRQRQWNRSLHSTLVRFNFGVWGVIKLLEG